MRKFVLSLALVVLAMPLWLASPAQATGAVCPSGNVKWEADGGGYEYTDGSATVSGNADQVNVSATPGFEITGVCIKIGGPGGGQLYTYATGGTFGPYDHGISHVVVTTKSSPPPPPPPPVNSAEVTPGWDCDGWSIAVTASEGGNIFVHPGYSGAWTAEITMVFVSVVVTWEEGIPLSHSETITITRPAECPPPPPPPPPQTPTPPPPPPPPSPTPPPWNPGALACVRDIDASGFYEIYWLDGTGAIGGLSQPMREFASGAVEVFFTNPGEYLVVSNGEVVDRFSMPGCASWDAPPATPAPSTGSGGPSTPSSLAGVGAIVGFLAVLLGGTILFFAPRRVQG